MPQFEPIEADVIHDHLRRTRSGVSLNLSSTPGVPGVHRFYKGRLVGSDRDRIILWFQNEKETINESCRLTDLHESAGKIPRVRSFIDGNPEGRLSPIDLTTAEELALVAVTDDVCSSFLYLIDGNHRAISRQVQGTHYNPDTWVHPAKAKRQQIINQEWRNRNRRSQISLMPMCISYLADAIA